MSLMRCCWVFFIENPSLDLFRFILIIYVIWSELRWYELSIYAKDGLFRIHTCRSIDPTVYIYKTDSCSHYFQSM